MITDNDAIPAFAPIPEWVKLSGVSRSATYERLNSGELKAKKVGNRTLIGVAAGLRWLNAAPDYVSPRAAA